MDSLSFWTHVYAKYERFKGNIMVMRAIYESFKSVK